jgi:large subunit ribosomal protein L4
MYKSAMRSILSSLVEENRVVLGSSINIENPKTKDLIDFMNKIGFKGGLIIVNEISENIKLASRNIPNLQIVDVNSIDPISLLRHESTLISEDSLPKLEELLT